MKGAGTCLIIAQILQIVFTLNLSTAEVYADLLYEDQSCA